MKKFSKVEEHDGNIHLTVQIPDPIIVLAQETAVKRQREMLQSWRNGPEFVAKEIAALEKMRAMAPKRLVKFVLDAKHGYGIREREDRTADNKLIMHAEADEWKLFGKGVWLPQHCVEKFYTDRFKLSDFSDQPRLIATYRLNNVSFEVATNRVFALSYTKPGTLFVDRTAAQAAGTWDHQVMYTVAADGSLLRGAAANVARELNPTRRYMTIALLILLFGVPPVFVAVRRLKSAKVQ